MFRPKARNSYGFSHVIMRSAESWSSNNMAFSYWMYCSMQTKDFPSIMVLYVLLRLLNTASSPRKHSVSAFSFVDVLSSRLILLGQFALRWPGFLHTKHNFSFSGQSSVTWSVVPHWKHRLIWGADARPIVSPCPWYQVLIEISWPLYRPVICDGMGFLITVILTSLLPVDHEVTRPLNVCISSSTLMTSPYPLNISRSLSLVIPTGAS